MVFPAKRDWNLRTAVLLSYWWLCPLIRLASGGDGLFGDFGQFPLEFCMQAAMVMCGLAMLWSFVATNYQITESSLVIRTGPIRRTLPLSEIFEVIPSRGNLVLCTAWSRDILTIRFHVGRIAGDSVVIAPRDQGAFIAEIVNRCPQMRTDGNALKRTGLAGAN
jgi:hypothetical protein